MATYKWKYLDINRDKITSRHGSETWEIGEWKKCKGKPKACSNGYHCSDELYQAYSYVAGEVLAKVEVLGKFDTEDDKYAYQEMRIVKAWEWDKLTSVKLAIYAAEQVIDIYEKAYPKDDRPRKAIAAAKRYSKNPTKKNADLASASAASASASAAASAAAASASASAYASSASYASYASAAAAYASAASAYASYASAAAASASAASAYASYASASAASAYASKRDMIKKINTYMKRLTKDLKEIK